MITKLYLLIFGGFFVIRIIYYRFFYSPIPFDIDHITAKRALIYLSLSIIFSIILLSIYYNLIRIYILKKPVNPNSTLFKMKKLLEEFMEKFGPKPALKAFFLFFTKIIPFTSETFIWVLMQYITTNPFTFLGKYYYRSLYLIFIFFPKIIVSSMFLIDVYYFKHVEFFFKWSLLLVIPLVFNAILGILKIYYDENITIYENMFTSTTEIKNGITDIQYTNMDYKETIGSVEKALARYFMLLYFIEIYTVLKIRNNYFLTIFTMHTYLAGFLYILYSCNYFNLLIKFICFG